MLSKVWRNTSHEHCCAADVKIHAAQGQARSIRVPRKQTMGDGGVSNSVGGVCPLQRLQACGEQTKRGFIRPGACYGSGGSWCTQMSR